MKIKINILVFVLVVATFLGGCNMKKAFKNQEEAQEYVLSCMEQKYGETFIITDEGDYNNYGPFYGNTYTCEVASEDAPEKSAKVLVRESGSLEDNWAVYYFEDSIVSEVKQNLIDDEDIQMKEISLAAPTTTERWKESDDQEEYLLNSGAYVEIVAECEEGLTSYEYAKIIENFLRPVYQLKVNTEISVKVGRTYIFFEKIQVAGNSPTAPLSVEQIEKRVNDMISSSPF